MPKDGNGSWTRRVHPKLRMMMDGDADVNACRAETTGCVAVSAKVAALATPLRLGTLATEAKRRTTKAKKPKTSKAERSGVVVNVFVQTNGPNELSDARGKNGNFAMLRVPLDDVPELAKRPDIAFVEPAENLKPPGPIRLATGATGPKLPRVGEESMHGHGAGVLIGIIDVDGFDWMHPDFNEDPKDKRHVPRFLSIWDQGGATHDSPDLFDYGSEITLAHMQAAIAEAPSIGVSPHDLEPQSQMNPGSHGTHVASIAAGNSGVSSKADIAAVLVSLPPIGDRRLSFYDSTRLIDAVNYLLAIADARKQPISINVSLGTNGHAHDGSSALDRWIDALLTEPGRSICVAAGNAGQERAEAPGDLGYILGRIHTSGKLGSRGLDHDIEWIVAGDNVKDVSENELEIWYEPQDRIAISVLPPDGANWIGPIEPGKYLENHQLPDKTMLSIYNERYHPANGNNYMAIYLTPFMNENTVLGIAPGSWLVRLHGREIRDGRFHGWIERDDPLDIGDGSQYWPSYFSSRSNVDSSSVSSLACGWRIVSVANLDEAGRRINISSSQGPTRDGRFKPDVAARGTEVWAANGFGDPKQPWISMTGTSMASPYVAGTIGLMLAAQPKLTAAQINGIVKSTARPLPGRTYEWVNDAGFGVIDAVACVSEAKTAHDRAETRKRGS